MKRIVLLLLLCGFTNTSFAISPFPADPMQRLKWLETFGIVNYGKLNASDTPELLMLKRENTGVYSHQYVKTFQGENLEKMLSARGLIKLKRLKNGSGYSKHLLVFNPKDRNTYCWVPFKDLKETFKRIENTGKTLPVKPRENRLGKTDLLMFLEK